jgi:glycosyltransferase involved in cell wall biosynthesis
MRLLFYTSDANFYGANRSLLALVSGLDRKRFQIAVIGPPSLELKSKFSALAISYTECNGKSSYYYTWRSRFPFMDLIRAIINFFVGVVTLFRHVIEAFSLRRLIRSFDIVISNSSISDFGLIAASLLRKKHIWIIREVMHRHYSSKPLLGAWYQGYIFRLSNQVVYISDYVKDELSIFKILRGVVINDGIYTETQFLELQNSSRPLSDRKPTTFAIVGVIHQSKGQTEAVHAFAKIISIIPSARLFIVGAGKSDSLIALVQHLNLTSKVVFTGYLEDLSEIYKVVSYVLNCSSHEALGRVSVESLAHGCVLIAKNSGATPNFIRNRINGFLVNDVAEIPSIIADLEKNSDGCIKIIQNGYVTAREQFSIEKCAQKFSNVFENL